MCVLPEQHTAAVLPGPCFLIALMGRGINVDSMEVLLWPE
jgi:hypothetical protein